MTKKALILLGVLCGAAVLFFGLHGGSKAPTEVARADLQLRDGLLYWHGAKQPYTGAMVERFGNGARKVAIDLRKGKVDGMSRGWYESGQSEVEEVMVAGFSDGPRTRWYPNGQKKSEEHIVHGVLSGHYVEWHENGHRAVEMTMKDGQPDGVVQAWYPDGARKSETRFAGGKMVGRQFFPASAAPAREVAGR